MRKPFFSTIFDTGSDLDVWVLTHGATTASPLSLKLTLAVCCLQKVFASSQTKRSTRIVSFVSFVTSVGKAISLSAFLRGGTSLPFSGRARLGASRLK